MCVHKVRSKENSFYSIVFTFCIKFRLKLNFRIWVFCVKIIRQCHILNPVGVVCY